MLNKDIASAWQSLAAKNACMRMQAKMHSMHADGTLLTTYTAYKSQWESCHSSTLAAIALCLLLTLALWRAHAKRPVYLCDFYCFQPPEHLGGDVPSFIDGMRRSKKWNEQSLDFMTKVSQISGLGDRTYFPEGVKFAHAIANSVCVTLRAAHASPFLLRALHMVIHA